MSGPLKEDAIIMREYPQGWYQPVTRTVHAPPTDSTVSTGLRVWTIILTLLFVICTLSSALFFPLQGDEALLATTAKNMANGLGWVSSYGELKPFDAEITTGPGSLWAVVLGVYVFGNQLWVPKFFATLLNMGLFFLIVHFGGRRLPKATRYWLWIAAPLIISRINPEAWSSVLGDLPASLFIVLSALLLSDALQQNPWRYGISSGVLAGMAMLTKTAAWISGLGLPGALVLLLFHKAFRERAIKALFIWALGVGMVVVPWSLYEQHTLAALPEAARLIQGYESEQTFLHMGSGIGKASLAWQENRLFGHMYQQAINNWYRYSHELKRWASPLPLFSLYILMLAGFLLLAWQRLHQPVYRSVGLITACAIAHLSWALFFSDWLFGRHIYHGLFIGMLALVLALSLKKQLLQAVAIIAMVLVVFFPNAGFPMGELYRVYPPKNPLTVETEALVAFVEANHRDDTLAGCGYYIAREVEYALPGANRVVDCARLWGNMLVFDEQAFAQRHPQAIPEYKAGSLRQAALEAFIRDTKAIPSNNWPAPVQWREPIGFFMVEYPYWFFPNGIKERIYDALLAECDDIVYASKNYKIRKCDTAALHRYIDKMGGLPHYPPQWLAEWLAAKDR